MIKAHKIRLNPASEQEAYFYRASGVARFAWNWALDEYKRRKAAGQKIDWNEIKLAGSGCIGETPVEFAATALKRSKDLASLEST
jgi:transposase